MGRISLSIGGALLVTVAMGAVADRILHEPQARSGETPLSLMADARAAEIAAVPVYPDRNAFFGDLHLHTSYSTDAVLLQRTVVTPDQAYRYAQGEPIVVLGQPLKMARPLDFMAVTDHAELIGSGREMMDPDSPAGRTPYATQMRARGAPDADLLRKLFTSKNPVPGIDWDGIGKTAWQRYIEASEKNYRPGRFTTFIAFEWSATPGFQNLHRNVIFRSSKVAYPYSAADSERPEDLWTYMEENRRHGIESLAIPHNANLSNGLMFAWNDSDGRRINRAYALRRAANEPLNEIVQTKGQSEVHPALAPDDEFANFEVFEHMFSGAVGKGDLGGNYFREAIARGLVLSEEAGANPFKMGVVGGSDMHTGLVNPQEDNYRGAYGPAENPSPDQIKAMLGLVKDTMIIPNAQTSGGDMTGVWAVSNTREAIFDAMRRRETFATSGPRMRVRLFAGWGYSRDMLTGRHWGQAYGKGTPMGGDLSPAPARAGSPKFLIWAVKDPQGANLDRVQMIKVWLENGRPRQKIFDVALSGGRHVNPATGRAPTVGNSSNLKTATYTNSIGATELSAYWQDPGFDRKQAAAYYVRALEIPTPRWTTILATRTGVPLPADVPATIQERAWSSPIWYAPSGRPAK